MSFVNGNEARMDETTAQGEPKCKVLPTQISARVRDLMV
jgi:hypothetical protein